MARSGDLPQPPKKTALEQRAYSPNDPEREKAYANIYGYSVGVGLTKGLSVTGYIPMKTTGWFNPIPRLHDFGPVLQDIWETIQSALD